MRWGSGLVIVLLLTCRRLHEFAASDERPDVGHDEDVHPAVAGGTGADVPDSNTETSWDPPDAANRDSYGDADWHPPPSPSLLETRPDASAHAAPETRGGSGSGSDRTPNRTCGEVRGRLAAGRCRLEATLPAEETPAGRRCPDVFRCSDDVSYWLQESHGRKEQLEELRETMEELQEELRSHRHRAKALQDQAEESARINLTLARRLRSLEQRQSEVGGLLRVHASLLHELQAQLRNLTAAVRRMTRSTGCTVSVGRAAAARPLGMRDTLPPDGQYLSFCPSDCASLYHNGVRRSGVYTIVLSPGTTLSVYCDMETEGGGWTVFQRRRDGTVSFNRGWSEYREGFGEPRGEHWLGNRHVHLLSNQGHYSLRIDLRDWSHAHRHALYHSFRIDSEENRYRLHVSGFSGTVEDSFGWYHNLQGFSTPDTGNICAEISHSGWWFHQCFYANLNGVYYKGGRYSLRAQNLLGPDGIVWFSWKDSDFYSLKAVAMMMRPRNFRARLSP